jgi:deoxyribonuclease V
LSKKMKIPEGLRWDLSPQAAVEQQRALAERVRPVDDLGPVNSVAGVDVGFEEGNTVARAAVVVLEFPLLLPIAAAVARRPVTFPYVPGLLAYRELPAIFGAFEQLDTEADLILVDGQGRAHPRRFGIACHLGVLLDKPTIGCAKSVLVGRAEPPADPVGAWTPLVHKGETVGASLRTRRGTNPIYVSVGHRVRLETAIALVLDCCKGYRLPEPTRLAHRVAGGATLDLAAGQQRLF